MYYRSMKKWLGVLLVCGFFLLLCFTSSAQAYYPETVINTSNSSLAETAVTKGLDLKGDGTYGDPFIITSGQTFIDFLQYIEPETSKVFFYKFADGVSIAAESTAYYTFAEIVFMYGETVLMDGVYCVKTGYYDPYEWYHTTIPLPDGYTWRRLDYVDIGNAFVENGPYSGYLPLLPGKNIISVNEYMPLTGAGEIDNPYIFHTKEEWSYAVNYNYTQFMYYRVKGLTLEELEAAAPLFTTKCWWLDLRTADGAIERWGFNIIFDGGGMMPVPIDYEVVTLPYGYTVEGSDKIVVLGSLNNLDLVPGMYLDLPIFNTGDIVDLTGSAITASGSLLFQASSKPAAIELYGSSNNLLLSETVTVSGAYTLTAPVSDSYTLVVTKPGYLKYTIQNLTLAAGEVIPTIDLRQMAGDIDGDGVINATDLTYLLSEFNHAADTYPNADLDGNGVVNATDLTYLLAGFNKHDVVAIND